MDKLEKIAYIASVCWLFFMWISSITGCFYNLVAAHYIIAAIYGLAFVAFSIILWDIFDL